MYDESFFRKLMKFGFSRTNQNQSVNNFYSRYLYAKLNRYPFSSFGNETSGRTDRQTETTCHYELILSSMCTTRIKIM
jgi:hypothetical protein